MRKYAILGSGAAGLAAAQAIRAQDASASITLLSDDRYGYYSRPGLAYLLSGEATREQLFPYPREYFSQMGLNRLTMSANSIQPGEHRIALANGQYLPYDRLLIATGATATRLDLPGCDVEGVVKLDNMDDTVRILKLARRGKTAVVAGGGITALELAEGLRARGMRVDYFLRGDRYWSAVLDETESGIVEKRLAAEGIHLHYHTELTCLHSRNGYLTGVRYQEEGQARDMRCHLLAVAIGIQPRRELAVRAGLSAQRGILVNELLQTSDADIFAAGDVAQAFDPISGEYTLDSLWGPAIVQGRTAGLNMAGCSQAYRKRIPFNVTRLAGLVTTIIGQVGKDKQGQGPRDNDVRGIMRGDSETWRQKPNAELAQTYHGDNRLRIFLSAQRIVGAVVMGDQELSAPLQLMIVHGMDISRIRPNILQAGAPIAEMLREYWRSRGTVQRNQVGASAMRLFEGTGD